MEATFDQSARAVQAALDSFRLGIQVAETMIAAQGVIAQRTWMMAAGFAGHGPLPLKEMAKFVPEKATAFNEASRRAAEALTAKSLKSAGDLGMAGFNDGMAMLELYERALATSAAWWRPVHATATGNARRLSRRKAR